MHEDRRQNNPKKVFEEQDDLVAPSRKLPAGADIITSVRQSDVISTAPDDIDWNKVYAGKQHGLYSVKREPGSRIR